MYHQFKIFLNNILFLLSKTELVFKFVFFCTFNYDWSQLFFTLIPHFLISIILFFMPFINIFDLNVSAYSNGFNFKLVYLLYNYGSFVTFTPYTFDF